MGLCDQPMSLKSTVDVFSVVRHQCSWEGSCLLGKPRSFPEPTDSYFFCRNPKYNDLFAVGHGSCK